jgi:hypothetical protein
LVTAVGEDVGVHEAEERASCRASNALSGATPCWCIEVGVTMTSTTPSMFLAVKSSISSIKPTSSADRR